MELKPGKINNLATNHICLLICSFLHPVFRDLKRLEQSIIFKMKLLTFVLISSVHKTNLS